MSIYALIYTYIIPDITIYYIARVREWRADCARVPVPEALPEQWNFRPEPKVELHEVPLQQGGCAAAEVRARREPSVLRSLHRRGAEQGVE